MQIKTIHGEELKENIKYAIPMLPIGKDLETIAVFRKTNEAIRALAELKGFAYSMPNQAILINTLSLQEAKESSAIENIITTHDELYKSDASNNNFMSIEAKEVYNYATVLRHGHEKVKNDGFISNNTIKNLQAELEGNNAGFRSQSGTSLKNEQTGEIVYTPPQREELIKDYMDNLEKFINDNDLCGWNDLVKMAVIHHQFESIHPFFDGNGRTGRIINVLYLVKQGLLDTPILYLSRYINKNKADYYRLLQQVRDTGEWEEWILFILEGVRFTSYQTIDLIKEMKSLMQAYKYMLRKEEPKIYSQDLLNNIFFHPYTKISFLEKDLNVHRNTARRYLNTLAKKDILTKHKIGKENLYINHKLYKLLMGANNN